jgi:hypothetical protein
LKTRASFHAWEHAATLLARAIGVEGTLMENRHTADIVQLPAYESKRIIIINSMLNIDFIATGVEWTQQEDRASHDEHTIFIFHGDEHYFWCKHPSAAIFKGEHKHKGIIKSCKVCFTNHMETKFHDHVCFLEEIHECDKCGKRLANSSSLERHKLVGYEEEPMPDNLLNCPACAKSIDDFYSIGCFAYHQKTCFHEDADTLHCNICDRNYCGNHDCSDWGSCKNCGYSYPSREYRASHRCFTQITDKKYTPISTYKGTTWFPHYVYDFETYREEEEEEEVWRHGVFAWAIQLVKPKPDIVRFMETQKIYDMFECKFGFARLGDGYRFHGKDLKSFIRCCEMLTVTKGKLKMKPTFWAHNGSRFDAKFILDYFLNEMKCQLGGASFEEVEDHKWVQSKAFQINRNHVQLTMVGTRALKIKIKEMTFKCSLAHVGGQLRDAPKMFNLPVEVAKGEFPYGRLKQENWGKQLPFPSLEEFDVDSKPADRRREITEWWEEQIRINGIQHDLFDRTIIRNYPCWDFDEELWKYLFADVAVLSEVMAAYDTKAEELQTDLGEGYVSPLDFATAPAWSLAMYKTWFLPQDKIAILKPAEEKFIRESLHGGRTDKRCNWLKVREGDSIQYMDFTSLYPSVQKSGVHDTYYPVGVPTWYRKEGDGPRNNREFIEMVGGRCGFFRIKSRHLKYVTHPTLPHLGSQYEGDVKLLFRNVYTEGVFALPEIMEAIDQGEIEVTEVIEALFFERGSVFDQYVDFFFQVKNKAEEDGNEGLRSLAKLLLNSLWGKLGQRSYGVTEWIRDGARRDYLWEKFQSGEYELMSVVDKSDMQVRVNYKIPEDYSNLQNTACQLAAYVSMWGRVILHKKVLATHGQRVLYCDTDSGIIYLRAGEEIPYAGSGLGLLCSEVGKMVKKAGYTPTTFPGAYIDEVVLLVPKTYGMIIRSSNGLSFTKVICKGFEPSYANSKEVTFQAMKDLVFTQYDINTFLNGKRPLEEFDERTSIPGSKRLTFVSSMATGKIAPRERKIRKAIRGEYTKGEEHPFDPRFIKPFGPDPPSHTFLDSINHVE